VDRHRGPVTSGGARSSRRWKNLAVAGIAAGSPLGSRGRGQDGIGWDRGVVRVCGPRRLPASCHGSLGIRFFGSVRFGSSILIEIRFFKN
jgi:hypothetical protein